jgi:hypothetical protein
VRTGAELRDRGIHQLALAELFDDWPARADKAIRHLAGAGHEFTSDDVRELCGDPARANQLACPLPGM